MIYAIIYTVESSIFLVSLASGFNIGHSFGMYLENGGGDIVGDGGFPFTSFLKFL